MADRETDILLIGGGVASATAAATLREEGFGGSILLARRELDPPLPPPPAPRGGLGRLDPPRRPRARPALPPPAGIEGLPAGPGVQGGRARAPGGLVGGAGRRTAHAHERHGARNGRAHRDPPEQGGDRLRPRACRNRRD